MSIGTFLKWGISGDHKTERELRGATVIAFSCDGCMASDHKFMWSGMIDGFERTHVYGQPEHERYTQATVLLDKKDDEAGDARDYNLGTATILIEDGSLQFIRPGLYFWFR